jgi:hypothetical protein
VVEEDEIGILWEKVNEIIEFLEDMMNEKMGWRE